MGIPFAIPAYTFRLERAWPLAARDGYLHCVPYEEKPWQMACKRLLDIVCSASALWVLTPILLAVMFLIKVTSRGPIFFRQQRAGLRGQPFSMLKFRSMVVDAERIKAKLMERNEQTGPVFKMRNDPRITRIGRFIRKYSIDELPQLVNVLRGDMSIVGPRPPLPAEVAQYEQWQLRRLCVRPGLTCIWQVSGRSQVSFEQWMHMDMQYIDDWSLRRDVDLILKTLPAVLTGRGAS
jgi:exopolysaccharide biosynthesis polyprenyl glycosylphosphotransferase